MNLSIILRWATYNGLTTQWFHKHSYKRKADTFKNTFSFSSFVLKSVFGNLHIGKKGGKKQVVQVHRLEIVLVCKHKETFNPSLGDTRPSEIHWKRKQGTFIQTVHTFKWTWPVKSVQITDPTMKQWRGTFMWFFWRENYYLSQKHTKTKDLLSGNMEIIIASDNWTEDRDTINWSFIPLIKNYLNNEKVTLIFF